MLRTKNTIIGKISSWGIYCNTTHSSKIQENTDGPRGKISTSIDQILHSKLNLEASNSMGSGKLTIINTTFEPAKQINNSLAQSSPNHSRFQIPNSKQIMIAETFNLHTSDVMENSICNLTLAPTLPISAISTCIVHDNTLSKLENQHSVFISLPTIIIIQRETICEYVKHVPAIAKIIRNQEMGEGSNHTSISNTSSCSSSITFRNTDKLRIELEASEKITAIVSATTSASTIRQRPIMFAATRILKHDLICLLQLLSQITWSIVSLAPGLILASSQWIRRLVLKCVRNVSQLGNKCSWSVLRPSINFVRRIFRYLQSLFHDVPLYFSMHFQLRFRQETGKPLANLFSSTKQICSVIGVKTNTIFTNDHTFSSSSLSHGTNATNLSTHPNGPLHASKGANLATTTPGSTMTVATPSQDQARPASVPRAGKK